MTIAREKENDGMERETILSSWRRDEIIVMDSGRFGIGTRWNWNRCGKSRSDTIRSSRNGKKKDWTQGTVLEKQECPWL